MAEDSLLSADRSSRRLTAVLVLLIAIFASLCLAAEWHKSITIDELVYTVAGYINLHVGDFRISPEHPPLWRMWAMLGNLNTPLKFNYQTGDWLAMPQEVTQYWRFSVCTAYHTPGNDIDALIWRCRPVMVSVGVMLAIVIARWAGQLGGGVAAVVAVTLFCFDPTFLAHSPLVTNDVPVTFALALATYAIWRLGHRVTVWRVLLLGLAVGLCLNTKLSGLSIVPLGIVLLLSRAISAEPWTVLGRPYQGRRSKGAAALVVIGCCAAISYGITWASYGFRYSATADNSQGLNVQREVDQLRKRQLEAMHPDRPPTEDELIGWHRPIAVDVLLQLMQLHVMPEGWLFGVLFSLQNAQSHAAFLFGRIRESGWWYYFPVAMLLKLPVASLAALAGAAGTVVSEMVAKAGEARSLCRRHRWAAACLGLPLLLYLSAAMTTPMDIGIRYILPVFPWMYVATGVVAAYAWRRWTRISTRVLPALAIALAAETAAAFPNYLSFFNIAAGRSRGGELLLGDSNLDWGQDLFALRQWQEKHPDVDLRLCYFGSADPLYYGLRYTPLPGGYPFERQSAAWPSGRCTVAISATYLQGLYLSPQLRAKYAELFRGRRPVAVLGGSIYLFEFDSL